MPHQFSILHLSDLHERASREAEPWRRRRVLGESFLANLDALLEDGAIDLVCFTGDLADWGLPAEYEAAGQFLATVMERVKLPRERLFLVPGNHDIARKQSAESWALLRENLPRCEELQVSRWFRGRQAPPGLADEHRESLFLRQQAFRDFLIEFGLAAQHPERSPHGRLGYRISLRLPGRPFELQVIGLDSAWLSGDNNDAGRLRLTEDQVMQLCSLDGQQLPGYRLALAHHPLTELADGVRCRRQLAVCTDLLLRGHLHESEPELWADPERQLLQFTAGCLYEGEKADTYPNACQVIRISVDDAGRPLGYSLRFRAFSSRGGHWHDDNSLYRSAQAGRLELMPDGKVRGPFLVPVKENAYFTGREQILSQVEVALSKQQIAAVIQPQALSGLGGIGKTQIAVAYAYQHRTRYRAVLWIPGGSEEELISSFAALVVSLNLPVAADNRSLDDRVAAARHWLETQEGWLLIVDGAEQPAALSRLLPRSGRGHVLLTSRAHDLQKLGLVCPLVVGTLPTADAVEFLIRRTRRSETNAGERAAAEVLAQELGGLPLALEQAAAFIVTNAAPIADYLDSYKKHRLRLLNRSQPIIGDYPHTVATTWHINFEQIKHLPASVALLRLIAFMAPDAIPTELLIAAAEHFDKKLAHALAEVATDPLALSTVMEPLIRYSLIRRDVDERTVSVHRLVQEVVKDSLEPQSRREYTRRVVQALSAKFPDPALHAEWPGCERFLRHALMAVNHCSEYQLEGEEAARLHNQVALYLDQRMQAAAAEPLYRKAIALRQKVDQSTQQNPNNRRSLVAAQCNLSSLLIDTGRAAEARSTMEQTIHDLETKEGAETPTLAGALLRRCDLLRLAGRYAEAEPNLHRAFRLAQKDLLVFRQCGVEILAGLAANAQELGQPKIAQDRYQQAMTICEAIYGKDSQQYAHIQVNLGRLQREQGLYQDAEVVARNAVNQLELMVGREHSQYASAAKSLAAVLIERGKYDEAQKILRTALEIWKQLYGAEHIQVAGTLRGLATCLRHLGQFADAVELGEQSLRMEQLLLGPNHPSLYSVLNEVGLTYLSLERLDDAESAFRRALSLCKYSHGEESAEAATAHNNIALVLEERGQYLLAIAEHEHSNAIQRKCWGDEHPETLLSQYNLAHLFAQLSRYQEAQTIYVKVLAGWRKAYGAVHPRLVVCLSGLGQISMALGEGEAAERYLKEAGQIAEKAYPKDHPDSAQILAALGQHYQIRGRSQEAQPYFERALAILNKSEPTSMLTAIMMSALGACLNSLGRYGEAEQLLRRAIEQTEARLGQDHPRLGPPLTDLALCLLLQERLPEADPVALRALALVKQSEGTVSPHYATALSNLAHLRREQNRLAEATALEQQALEVRNQAFGPDHPAVALSSGVLADLALQRGDRETARGLLKHARQGMRGGVLPYLRAQEGMRSGLTQARLGDLQAATTTFQETITAVEAEYGKTSPELFQGLLNLVATQLERGELPEAEQSIQKLRARLAQLSPPTPQVLLAIHQAEATLLRHRGKLDQARALLESALDMDGITQDMFVEERISLLNNLGGVIEAQGSLTQAIPYYEQAQQLLPQVSNLPLGHELELTLLANLAGNLFKQGSKEKSAELYNRVEVLLNKSGGKEHPRHILIMQQRGAQALAQQQWVLARQLLTQTLDRAKESLASEHPLLGLVYRQLGKATEESAALEEAAEYYAKALSHDERTYGQDAPQLRAVLQALEELATKRGDRALAVKMAERAAHIGRKQ